jgi:hypothetical protein
MLCPKCSGHWPSSYCTIDELDSVPGIAIYFFFSLSLFCFLFQIISQEEHSPDPEDQVTLLEHGSLILGTDNILGQRQQKPALGSRRAGRSNYSPKDHRLENSWDEDM